MPAEDVAPIPECQWSDQLHSSAAVSTYPGNADIQRPSFTAFDPSQNQYCTVRTSETYSAHTGSHGPGTWVSNDDLAQSDLQEAEASRVCNNADNMLLHASQQYGTVKQLFHPRLPDALVQSAHMSADSACQDSAPQQGGFPHMQPAWSLHAVLPPVCQRTQPAGDSMLTTPARALLLTHQEEAVQGPLKGFQYDNIQVSHHEQAAMGRLTDQRHAIAPPPLQQAIDRTDSQCGSWHDTHWQHGADSQQTPQAHDAHYCQTVSANNTAQTALLAEPQTFLPPNWDTPLHAAARSSSLLASASDWPVTSPQTTVLCPPTHAAAAAATSPAAALVADANKAQKDNRIAVSLGWRQKTKTAPQVCAIDVA